MYRKEDRDREILEKRHSNTVTEDNIRERDTEVVYRNKKRSLGRQDETGTNRKTERGRKRGTLQKEADMKENGDRHANTTIIRKETKELNAGNMENGINYYKAKVVK
jgi:hypothetical protein